MLQYYTIYNGFRKWCFCIALLASPGFLSAQGQAYADVQPLNHSFVYTGAQRSLREVLNEVQDHFNVSFVYESTMVEGKQIAGSVSYKGKIESTLNHLLDPVGLKFKKINERTYSILPKALPKTPNDSNDAAQPKRHQNGSASATLIMSSDLFYEALPATTEIVVRGVITDDSNSPVPGVNILLKGTTTGTTTDMNGRYSISVPDENAILIISFIGYTTTEIAVGSRTEVNVQLTPDVRQLTEVVVVGYGTQKRSSVTGAVATVTAKEVTALPVVSVESAIQGRVPGVSVVNNGSPGSAPIVRIRGIGSISYGSGPLYVIDGLPAVGNISNYDTKDIESVEVLKDASSSAIYGSRAANGVIIITTKKGSRDKKLHVDIDSYYGVQQAWKQLDLLKREDYLRYGTGLINNAAGTIPHNFTHQDDPIYPGASRTYRQTETDWQDEMFRSAPITQTNVSVSNATDNTTLYTSLGYFKQEGIMLGTDFERYSYRINAEQKISKRFTFGQNINVSYSSTQNEASSGARTQIQHIVRQVPYIPVEDPTKLGGYRAPDNNDGTDPENPVRIAKQDINKNNILNIFGLAYLNVKITDALSYRFTTGITYSSNINKIDKPIYNDGFNGRVAHLIEDKRVNIYNPYFSNQLTFEKVIGKHSINAIAVAERQDGITTNLATSGQQPTNGIGELLASVNQSVNDGSKYETTLFSYLTRVNYEYAGKYLLSASIRRDGNSAFAPGKKWDNFPAVSVGWRINEETFMKAVPAISELKIRASYGLVGFSGIGAYDWQAVMKSKTTYPFNNTGTSGSYFDALSNTDLAWEKTKMSNVGLDLGLFENRVTFSMEVYNRKVDNLILDVPLAPSMGYSQGLKANIAGMKNWGYEFQAGYNKGTGDFRFNIAANIGITRNEILNLDNPSATIYAGNNSDFGGFDITRTEGGHSIQGFYGWQTDGIFQSQAEIDAANALDGNATTKYQDKAAPGDIRFKDFNNDGKIDSDDRTYLGSYLPDFTYGLNFSANYKSFDFTVFLQGVQGNEIYNGTKVLTQGMLRLFGAEEDVLNAWTPDNTNTDIPRAISGDPNQNTRTSNRFVEDGSYLRLKNLSIGYSIPSSVLQSFAGKTLSKVRVYVSSQNLLTLTDYSGYDPEIGTRNTDNATPLLTNGVDYGQFPSARTFLAGIQVGF